MDAVVQQYAMGDAVGAIVDAVGQIGDLLRKLVPGEDTAGDELPNEVTSS